jgi:ribonucleoside-diphosphate reductase alpha chain
VAQPLSAEKKTTVVVPEAAPEVKEWSSKKRLPQVRPAKTISFKVGDSEGYITAGEYPDDGIGEIFLKVSKQGSTLAGLMDAFSIAVSVGLQYGVPLEDYVSKFVNMRFEPSGMTNDPDIRFASSLMDYIFRRLGLEYLPDEKRASLGIKSIAERKEAAQAAAAEMAIGGAYGETPAPVAEPSQGPTLIANPKPAAAPSGMEVDAPLCYSCGSKMQPAGSCYVCSSCGSTSGCS